MNVSVPFTYVPYVGHENIVNVTDNDTGLTKKAIVSLSAAFQPSFVPKNASGDSGGGAVASYTSTDPVGRRGNMITNIDLLSSGEASDDPEETSLFYMLVRIPAGLAGLLPPQYTLANQPPVGSFDYSKFMPRTDARGCLSFYGVTDILSSGFFPPTTRFPTVPNLPPFAEGAACPLLYIPVGFYPSINTILNDLNGTTTVTGFNITIDDDQDITDLYGAMLIQFSFNGSEFAEGSGKVEVDFSHSGQN